MELQSIAILIAGGGIGGLRAALSFHAAGFTDIQVIESAVRIEPMGVGVNLPPHATRELCELGVGDQLVKMGVPASELTCSDPDGGLISSEPRGTAAGYNWPQCSIRRGRLQMLLLDMFRGRLGENSVLTGDRAPQDCANHQA